ncbi:MAG: PAS domain S-box protein [Desulfobacterales bacterium]|nr:PAS domain S-box protein [Desulfobacterales bacterium]MDJ0885685.1 PAS domain S-box protein [Desulfobacterales bacterium]
MENNPVARDLLNTIPVGVFRMSPEGRFVDLNPAAADILGYPEPQAVMALPALAFLPDPSAWPLFLSRIEKETTAFELRFKHRDGASVPCTLTARANRDKNGRLLSIDGTMVPARSYRGENTERRRQTSYMRALQDIMLAVAGRVAPLEVLKILLKHTLALMHTRHGYFFQYEAQTDTLVLKIGQGLYREIVGFAIKKGDGLVGKVWQDQTPILINNYQNWSGRHPDAAWDAVYSVAGVPLKSKDSLLGVIGFLHTKEGRQIEDHEFELLNRFAELAAIALDKAKVDAKLEAELAERRQAEEAFVKSEERYRSVVEDLAEFVLRWRPEGRVIFANEAYCRYKGKPKAKIIGRNIEALFSKSAYDQALEIIARLSPDHPTEANDILTWGPDSQPIWEEWTDRGIFDAAGRLTEIQSVGRNITERKLADKALRENEHRFRSFFNSNPEGIILVDLEGRILDANRSLQKLAGYRLEELQGKPYHMFVNDRYHAWIAQNIQDLMRGLVTDEPLEIEYVNKGGTSVLISARGWVITDEDSQPVALGAFVRDVTKEKRLTAEKADLETQLQQTQKMETIGTLTGGIAHDFNNILAGILGYAELGQMETDKAQEGLRRYLSRIVDACHRARSLVKQILQFSRRDDTDLTPLAATPLFKEAVKLLRSTLPATIRISAEFNAKRDTVVADATQLHQVIMNLGTNAFHAMRTTGGTLTFVLENQRLDEARYAMSLSIPPGNYVKISIADTGPGIPDALLERIFEPYFTTKEKQEGTGLGLAVTFGIVKNLNGLIAVEQNVPGRTTFAVYLPLAKSSGARGAEPSYRLPRGRNQRIFCIDDEAVFLEVVQRHLEGLGYRVTTCRSSVEARDRMMAAPEAFDLIITDQTMPEVTGVQLAAEIRKRNPVVPIILCTGYSEVVTAPIAGQLGITALIMKPVTRSELAKTVHQALHPGPASGND